MKKLLCILASVALSVSMLFAGCSLTGADGRDGRDGKDGQNVTFDDVYNKYLSEHEGASLEDFLKEYLSYTDTELSNAASLRTAINRSLMSGVSILTKFAYTTSRPGAFGTTSKQTDYKVYTGSGAILYMDKNAGDAYVVTNCHVIYDDSSDTIYCNDIRLYLYGQDTSGVNYVLTGNDITKDENYRMSAEIVGASVKYDIALLKVSNSTVLKRSDAVAVSNKTTVAEALNDSFIQDEYSTVGETVYAIGNASGEGMSASNGIVSKDSENIDVGLSDVNEKETNSYRVLRTTAPINHGNSGGALYNTTGKIVGIVNAKDEGEDIDNMGYALPANTVRRLLVSMYDSYVSNGNKHISAGSKQCGINKALLNITTTVSDSYSRLNADGISIITETVRVENVEGAPARGVLQVNDVLRTAKLTSSDGTVKEDIIITRNYSLSEMLISARAGDTLTLKIERSGTESEVSIRFDKNHLHYYE
ncbi:MAG: S1C family serine protease [Clostridia bacterium]|nr:S1C family serine protease [Clostridia bacterium]